jgi:hypothetical protein
LLLLLLTGCDEQAPAVPTLHWFDANSGVRLARDDGMP